MGPVLHLPVRRSVVAPIRHGTFLWIESQWQQCVLDTRDESLSMGDWVGRLLDHLAVEHQRAMALGADAV